MQLAVTKLTKCHAKHLRAEKCVIDPSRISNACTCNMNQPTCFNNRPSTCRCFNNRPSTCCRCRHPTYYQTCSEIVPQKQIVELFLLFLCLIIFLYLLSLSEVGSGKSAASGKLTFLSVLAMLHIYIYIYK